jgi:hypothetical protein
VGIAKMIVGGVETINYAFTHMVRLFDWEFEVDVDDLYTMGGIQPVVEITKQSMEGIELRDLVRILSLRLTQVEETQGGVLFSEGTKIYAGYRARFINIENLLVRHMGAGLSFDKYWANAAYAAMLWSSATGGQELNMVRGEGLDRNRECFVIEFGSWPPVLIARERKTAPNEWLIAMDVRTKVGRRERTTTIPGLDQIQQMGIAVGVMASYCCSAKTNGIKGLANLRGEWKLVFREERDKKTGEMVTMASEVDIYGSSNLRDPGMMDFGESAIIAGQGITHLRFYKILYDVLDFADDNDFGVRDNMRYSERTIASINLPKMNNKDHYMSLWHLPSHPTRMMCMGFDAEGVEKVFISDTRYQPGRIEIGDKWFDELSGRLTAINADSVMSVTSSRIYQQTVGSTFEGGVRLNSMFNWEKAGAHLVSWCQLFESGGIAVRDPYSGAVEVTSTGAESWKSAIRFAMRGMESIDIQPFSKRSIGYDILLNVYISLICTYSLGMDKSPSPPLGAEGSVVAIDLNCAWPSSLGSFVSSNGGTYKIGLLALGRMGEAIADGANKAEKVEVIGHIYRLWYRDAERADRALAMMEVAMGEEGLIRLPDGGPPSVRMFRVEEKSHLEEYHMMLAMMSLKFEWCVDAIRYAKPNKVVVAQYKTLIMKKYREYEYSCAIVEAMIGTDPDSARYLDVMEVNRQSVRPHKGDRKPDGYDRGLIEIILSNLREIVDIRQELIGVLNKCVVYGWK